MTKSGGKSLAVRVAEVLRKEIIEERLKPGDKLHSESELMDDDSGGDETSESREHR